ncbi:putative Glycerol kinase [Blattamonas nauphoetae]|uniref:glycerol kinase n=1 Tax=Blattamonas nauphoetae TaxID=2049346 RepID=A0ABQ9XMY7_9EUKA|nr:putative Glycerol kinase [Blattamonas nauphoetae]
MPPVILSIDQGTTSSRVILFDEHGNSFPQIQIPHTQIFPSPGWTEHDPLEIVQIVRDMMDKITDRLPEYGFTLSDLKGIGITNQRETTLLWDRFTGKPLYNAIVWHDTRTTPIVDALIKEKGHKFAYVEKTGLPLSSYFSAFKFMWLKKNIPEVQKAIDENRCMFGTIDTWLIWNLTGGPEGGLHITDVTNASRTMLFNIHALDWDDDLCNEFGVPRSILPSIRSSSEIFGKVKGGKLDGVAIAGCIGDQQSALLGHKALNEGDAKVTYGTGCFLLMNTGNKPVISKHGLITTVGYKLGKDSECVYALEGSVATAGAVVQWMTRNIKGMDSPHDIGPMASKVRDSGGIVFVPSFSGFFAPRWRSDVKGCVMGLTLQTEPAHFCFALEEAIACQVREVLLCMGQDRTISSNVRGILAENPSDFVDRTGVTGATPATPNTSLLGQNRSHLSQSITEEKLNSFSNPALVSRIAVPERVLVDGGPSEDVFLMQLQADYLGTLVVRPVSIEATALGASMAAGLAVGVWSDMDDLLQKVQSEMVVWKAKIEDEERTKRIQRWERAVNAVCMFVDKSDEE